ncbi:FxsA family protein [Marinactinospora thermotolerans]|uniref:UPF0716 protein FxsA n=1 Tax=Marinactinospora thermotolerans DSM 45154 TaxID=1122192 RepID=A0A1T4T599_9ACTN|nr:FxsA family protein [Marinactinospora thermotolerans]SKA35665.1 UPF0716 protein FxsA [Marinactinospora thermotolerans DSM 45154]
MPLLAVIALMALPFLEVWVMILAAGQIGVAWTIALLFALSASGVFVVRRAGTRAVRDAQAAMSTGTPPRGSLLDMLMLFVGGILLITPGFITAVLGLVLVLPFTRPALRWAFEAWARRRIRRMEANVQVDLAASRAGGPAPGPQPRPGQGKIIQGSFVDPETDS